MGPYEHYIKKLRSGPALVRINAWSSSEGAWPPATAFCNIPAQKNGRCFLSGKNWGKISNQSILDYTCRDCAVWEGGASLVMSRNGGREVVPSVQIHVFRHEKNASGGISPPNLGRFLRRHKTLKLWEMTMTKIPKLFMRVVGKVVAGHLEVRQMVQFFKSWWWLCWRGQKKCITCQIKSDHVVIVIISL